MLKKKGILPQDSYARGILNINQSSGVQCVTNSRIRHPPCVFFYVIYSLGHPIVTHLLCCLVVSVAIESWHLKLSIRESGYQLPFVLEIHSDCITVLVSGNFASAHHPTATKYSCFLSLYSDLIQTILTWLHCTVQKHQIGSNKNKCCSLDTCNNSPW